jgi:uroporphyrinogen-III decarboxylase
MNIHDYPIPPRENYLRLMKNDNPQYLCNEHFYTNGFFFDSILLSSPQRVEGETVKDSWGVSWKWLKGHFAANPYITEETKVIKDITKWEKYVNVPWPSKIVKSWEESKARAAAFDRKNQLLMCVCFGGLFEMSHHLMGFEDALMNYLAEPEAMTELLTVIADYKIEYVKLLIDNLNPDMIHFHDDWGNKRSLFMSPATWRKMIRPHYERIYGYIRSRGVLIQHHADCVCAPIVEDMVELGIDVWQGIIPQNNIQDVQKRVKGRMALQGGIDGAVFDFKDWKEADVRKEVRRACDDYVPAGHFIPCIPNGVPLTPGINDVVVDEIDTYGWDFFKRLKEKR